MAQEWKVRGYVTEEFLYYINNEEDVMYAAGFIIENIASNIVMPIENGLTYLKNKLNNNDKFFENINELKNNSYRNGISWG